MTRATLIGLVVLSGIVLFFFVAATPTGSSPLFIVVPAAFFLVSLAALVVHSRRERRRTVWPTAGHDPDDGLPVPPIDERSVRRAVWRGVARTAAAAVIWGLVGLFVLQLLSAVWQRRGERDTRFARVFGTALQVANPGYADIGGGCCNTDLTSMETSVGMEARTAGAVPQSVEADIRLNLLGRIEIGSRPNLPRTPVDAALEAGRPDRRSTRRLLGELPDAIEAVAIVELRVPASQRALERVLGRHGRLLSEKPSPYYEVPPIFVEPVYGLRRVEHAGTFPEDNPLSWPEPGSVTANELRGLSEGAEVERGRGGIVVRRLGMADDDSLAEFRAWARELREGDDTNLDRLGLPPARVIKRIAADARAHALILEGASKRELLGYLADPAVRSVNIADVAFDVRPESVELHGGERGPRVR